MLAFIIKLITNSSVIAFTGSGFHVHVYTVIQIKIKNNKLSCVAFTKSANRREQTR
jgi:hypothetical protein